MGYTDATLIKINATIDVLGQLSTEAHGYPNGAVPQPDLVKKIMEQTGRRTSLAYRLIDISVQLGLAVRFDGIDPLGDQRLKYVQLTADGITVYQQRGTNK